MADATYQPPEGFRTMAQAAEQLGMSMVTLRKLVQRSGVQVYQDPRDGRAKLIRHEDIAQLGQPIPVPSGGQLKTAA